MNAADRFDRFARTDGVRANLKRKSIRGAVFMASGNAADVLIRLLSIAILARLLLPQDFGLLAMVTALTGVLDSFRDFGLSAATVQRPEINHQQVSNLFWVNVVVGVGLALVVSVSSPAIATFYQNEQVIGVCLTLSLVFIWNGLGVQHEALMIRQLRQGELATIRLTASLGSVVIAVLLALKGWGYWSLIWREITRCAINTAGVWIRCQWLPGFPTRNAGTRSLVRFGSELSFTQLLTGLVANVDRLLVGRFYGATSVGIYRQAQQLLLAPIEQLNAPITGVAQPALSALQREPARYKKFYEKIVFLVTTATLPLGLFVAICATDITLLMLGPTWIDAAIYVRIFGIAAAIRPAIATSAVVLVTCGQSTRFLAIAVVHSVVLTVLILLGLHWGPVGVAVAYGGTSILLMYPKLYYSFLRTPVTIHGFFSAMWPPTLAGMAMSGSLVVLHRLVPIGSVVGSLALSTCVAGLIYLATMWVQPRGRREFTTLVSDLRSALESKRQSAALDATD